MIELRRRYQALADETRLRILLLLGEGGELCLCHVQEILELAPSTASRHLALLREAGLVESRRAGKWVHFRLAGEEAARWLEPLRADEAAGAELPRLRERLAACACSLETPACGC